MLLLLLLLPPLPTRVGGARSPINRRGASSPGGVQAMVDKTAWVSKK
jgi:hypothetical protein